MLEKEYWGLLTSDEFNKKLNQFINKFGKPTIKKRLAIETNDWERPEIDSRIKITNGKAEFVQKTGDWNSRERKELEIPLVNNVQAILDFFKAIITSVNAQIPSQQIMQYENYIFDLGYAELKMAHQLGKTDRYFFEVELIDYSKELIDYSKDLGLICKDLDLEPDHEPKDKAFWVKWNQEVNIDSRNLSDDELKDLIEKYLAYPND